MLWVETSLPAGNQTENWTFGLTVTWTVRWYCIHDDYATRDLCFLTARTLISDLWCSPLRNLRSKAVFPFSWYVFPRDDQLPQNKQYEYNLQGSHSDNGKSSFHWTVQPSSMSMRRLSEDLPVLWPQSVSTDLSHFTTLDIWAFNIHRAQCGAPSRPCALALSLYPTRASSRFTRYFEGRSSTTSPSGVLTMHQSQIHPNMASAVLEFCSMTRLVCWCRI